MNEYTNTSSQFFPALASNYGSNPGKEAKPEESREARFETSLANNQYETLLKERSEKRRQFEALSNSPSFVMVGICQDMCPEFERHEREIHLDLSLFEMIPGTERPVQPGDYPRIDHRRAIKKYHRPAAGNEAPLPEDVRPAPVLRQTMNYIIDQILPIGDSSLESLASVHKFVRDRTRAIRQDFTLQHITTHLSPIAVHIHEEIARFHLCTGHRLCELDPSEYDPFQNEEQLRKVLHSLMEFYSEIKQEYTKTKNHQLLDGLANEAEFRAYHLASHLPNPSILRQALAFNGQSPIFQLSITFATIYHQRDYIKFFKLFREPQLWKDSKEKLERYLLGCALHPHFIAMRRQAMLVISKGFSPNQGIPMAKLYSWLGFEDIDEAYDLVNYFGLKPDTEGNLTFAVPPATTGLPSFEEEKIKSIRIRKSNRLVEHFIADTKIQDIIRGIGKRQEALFDLPIKPVQPTVATPPCTIQPLQPLQQILPPNQPILPSRPKSDIVPNGNFIQTPLSIPPAKPISNPAFSISASTKSPAYDFETFAKLMFPALKFSVVRQVVATICHDALLAKAKEEQTKKTVIKRISQREWGALKDSAISQLVRTIVLSEYKAEMEVRDERLAVLTRLMWESLSYAILKERICAIASDAIALAWKINVRNNLDRLKKPPSPDLEKIYELAAINASVMPRSSGAINLTNSSVSNSSTNSTGNSANNGISNGISNRTSNYGNHPTTNIQTYLRKRPTEQMTNAQRIVSQNTSHLQDEFEQLNKLLCQEKAEAAAFETRLEQLLEND